MPTRAGSTVDPRDRASTSVPSDALDWLRLTRPARTLVHAPLVVLLHGGPTLPRGMEALDGALAWLHTGTLLDDGLDAAIDRTLATLDRLIGCPLGHDPASVVVIGHGAGAHLAAMVAVQDPRPVGYVLVSGVYDVSDTDPSAPRHHSPLSSIVGSDADCIVAWASGDACTVRRQGQAWAATWSVTEWNRPAIAVEVAGRHHADIVDDLFDPSSELGTAVLRMISRTRTT